MVLSFIVMCFRKTIADSRRGCGDPFPPRKAKTRPREAAALWRGRFAENLRVLALALIPAVSANRDERTDSRASVR